MFELRGRIAFGAVLAVFLAVGLGTGLNAAVPNSSPTTGTHCWFLTYTTSDGSILSLGSPCQKLVAQNGVGSLNLTSGSALSIMLTNGWINAFYVNLQTHQVVQIPGVTFSSDYRQAFYNGQPIINGTRLPTPYTTTPVTNIPTCTWLDGTMRVLFGPMNSTNSTNGTISVKVVTSQGTVVTSGMMYISHRISASDWNGSADYCEALSSDTSTTGFMQVTDHPGNGLPPSGVYNFTVIGEYGANQTFRVVVPDVAVQPGTATYVTVSIPSAEVTVSVCSQENSCSTTTTTITTKGS
jgi:hypothetical protein